MPEFVNKSKTRIVYSNHYHWYKEAKITLSKYSVLIKEEEQLEDKTRKLSGGGRNKLEFFTKHWSLIIFHHAEQIPLSENAKLAADAARGLQGTTDGKRVFVFSRAFLDLSREDRLKLFRKDETDKPEPEPEAETVPKSEVAKRKQTANTDKADVRKRVKISSQPEIVRRYIARHGAPAFPMRLHEVLQRRTKELRTAIDKDGKKINQRDSLQDTHMDDVAEVHTNGTNTTHSLSTSPNDLRAEQPSEVRSSDQTGSACLTGKLLLKDIDLEDSLAQGEPIVDLEKISKDMRSSSEPPAESSNSKATSVHDGDVQTDNVQNDKVQNDNVHADDKVNDGNDTPVNVEPRSVEIEPNASQSMTEFNVLNT